MEKQTKHCGHSLNRFSSAKCTTNRPRSVARCRLTLRARKTTRLISSMFNASTARESFAPAVTPDSRINVSFFIVNAGAAIPNTRPWGPCRLWIQFGYMLFRVGDCSFDWFEIFNLVLSSYVCIFSPFQFLGQYLMNNFSNDFSAEGFDEGEDDSVYEFYNNTFGRGDIYCVFWSKWYHIFNASSFLFIWEQIQFRRSGCELALSIGARRCMIILSVSLLLL